MSKIPNELKYSFTHEWARLEKNGLVTVGITDHAQELLGDIVYVELPEVDDEIMGGEETGVVESVKAASDIYTPIGGTVIAINENLISTPELINSDPYGAGWLFRIQLTDEQEWNELLDAESYREQIAAQGH